MQEQGIAWMIAGGTHADSPEERRMRTHRSELARSGPHRSWRHRLASAIAGRELPAVTTTTIATDRCTA